MKGLGLEARLARRHARLTGARTPCTSPLPASGTGPISFSQLTSSACYGGWPSRAAFFVLDDTQPHLFGLEATIATLVTPTLADLGYELVRVAITGKDRPTVQIMADRTDGAPVGIEDCEAISRAVGALLDVEDPIQSNWTLEVSSPGIDRPLTRVKDWNRFAGHLARAEVAIPVDGRKRFSGTVLGADAQTARLRLEDGTDVALPLADIRRARLVLTDALIAATEAATKPH
jgi:ribosome maturation factor RimP